jgi:pyruvate formate lyase activating enzyme
MSKTETSYFNGGKVEVVSSLPGRAKISNSSLVGLERLPVVKEALFSEKLGGEAVRCKLCERLCALRPGELGDCKARVNLAGKLHTLAYGNLSVIESRPIEIKPFFHFWPGSTALTFSTWSCNLDCVWCQNYSLSKTPPDASNSMFYAPEEIVEMAVRRGDEGLCASFQEPTLLTEWVAVAFRVAHSKGLYCCFVSNGYMTIEALRFLASHGLDAIKIDIKGNSETYKRYCGGVRGDEVAWRNAKEAKRLGLHVEIVNLVVTDVNDDEASLCELVQRHIKEVGAETPIHFTGYYPAYKFQKPPTKVATLERAYRIARSEGILYPYIGNVDGHPYEDTYCPQCQGLLIRRDGWRLKDCRLTEDQRCPSCRLPIPITGRRVLKRPSSPLWV